VGAALLFSEFEETTTAKAKIFRPIYYLGCKGAFTAAIKRSIDDVDPAGGRALDLFAGTGVVASALASDRIVTTVDIQEYSRTLCSAVLRPAELSCDLIANTCGRVREKGGEAAWCFEPLVTFEAGVVAEALKGNLEELIELLESPPLIAFLDEQHRIPGSRLGCAIEETISRLKTAGLAKSEDTIVARSFGGVYFSFVQAVVLDTALSVAHKANVELRDTLMAVALSTASTLVNTVGKQFAQPIQPRNRSGIVKPGLAKGVYRDRSLDSLDVYRGWLERYSKLPPQNGGHQAVRMDYIDALRKHGPGCSVVYADPPYTRDHYSRFYHVLETMCLRDNPVTSRVMKRGASTISRGIYREDRHQSPFCIRSTAPGAFEALFSNARQFDLPLVLSYSPHEEGDGTHPRVVSMQQIIELARKHYKKVEIVAIDGVTHNQLNRNGLKLKKRDQAEVIVKCFV
jgi:adenine-specific DNA methylase